MPNKRKRRRITDGLIGLSSAAILSVYALGYLHTQPADGQVTTQDIAHAPAPVPDHGPLVLLATPTPAAPGQAQPQQAGAYRDGTYVGVGTSRHGNIQATVIIKDGKIASAAVSGCGTRYPCSDVNRLVSEVTAGQAVPVNHVSGATDSSTAYKQAVKSALAKAS